MRSKDVRAALEKKFAAPEYALFHEVHDGTGAVQRRSADAVAMGLWPSRGLSLQGFEIKVSRSDWLVEMKNPAKAEAIAQFCSHWWIVTPPGIVKVEEMPENWGLYEVKGSGLCCVKVAPKMTPAPITMPFLAALLRRADEHAKSTIREAVNHAMTDERGAIEKQIKRRVEDQLCGMRSRLEASEGALNAIHEACGVEKSGLGRYFDNGSFASAVGLVHKLGIANTYGGLHSIAKQLKPMAEAISLLVPETEDQPA